MERQRTTDGELGLTTIPFGREINHPPLGSSMFDTKSLHQYR